MENNTFNTLDYDIIVEDALRSVVRESLKIVQENGFQNDHHFYISFNPKYPGVIVPSELIDSNDKDEVKIILQHQFWDLKPDKEKFTVILSFNGKKKKIVVPYNSICSFSDPSVGFGLQFKSDISNQNNNKTIPNNNSKNLISAEKSKTEAEIVSLESFRSKKLD